MGKSAHTELSVNTHGIVFDMVRGKLFVIEGGIRGSMLATIYGTPHLYEEYKKTHELPPYEECVKMAKSTESAGWTKELGEEIKKLLGEDW
jgi:hypothetical protein